MIDDSSFASSNSKTLLPIFFQKYNAWPQIYRFFLNNLENPNY